MVDYSFDGVLHDLKNLSIDDFITTRIFDGIPYVFRDNYSDYINWRRFLSIELQIDPHDIILTGSAGLGYSFNPTKNFRPFNDQSDIDVCIISDYFFNVAWHDIRYLDMFMLPRPLQAAIEDHKRRLIYWETIATDKILPVLSFAKHWNQAMTTKRGYQEIESHDINFRIYRNAGSVRAYQKLSIDERRTYVIDRGM